MTKTVSVKMPEEVLRRIPSDNVSEFIRDAVNEKLARHDESSDWKPKTPYGRRLLALRQEFIKSGGKLLSPEEISEELRQRRGGLA